MNINPVEALWMAVNLFGAGVVFGNLVDAWYDWRAILEGAGVDGSTWASRRAREKARRIRTRANLRREALQMYVSTALVIVAIPALFREGDTPLTPVLAILISGAGGIALNSYLDRQTRRTLERLGWVEEEHP